MKANEQDSGHSGAERQCETDPSKTGRRGEAEGRARALQTQPAADVAARFLEQSSKFLLFFFFFFPREAEKSESSALVSLICSYIYLFI